MPMTALLHTLLSALWFIRKYRTRQAEAGTYVVAAQLRKQGVPLNVALGVLCPGARPRGLKALGYSGAQA